MAHAGLEVQHFRGINRHIWTAIQELGESADKVTVGDYLSVREIPDVPGGLFAYLEKLCAFGFAQNIEAYVRTLKEQDAVRQMCSVGRKLSQTTPENRRVSIEGALADLQRIEGEVADNVSHTHSADSHSQLIADLDAPVDMDVLRTPFGVVNNTYLDGGLRSGDLWVVGARPGEGKSSFAQLCLLTAANSGRGVPLLYSVEMTAKQVYMRSVSMGTGVPSGKIRSRMLTGEEKGRIRSYRPPNYICSPERIWRNIAQDAHRATKRAPVSLVVLDYLQIIEDGNSDLFKRVENLSLAAKNLARDVGVPVILLSQLSRQEKGVKPRRPRLGDLKGSDAIGANADFVTFLFNERIGNDKQDLPAPHIPQKVELIFEKNRHGRLGTVGLEFVPELTLFRPLGMGGIYG